MPEMPMGVPSFMTNEREEGEEKNELPLREFTYLDRVSGGSL